MTSRNEIFLNVPAFGTTAIALQIMARDAGVTVAEIMARAVDAEVLRQQRRDRKAGEPDKPKRPKLRRKVVRAGNARSRGIVT